MNVTDSIKNILFEQINGYHALLDVLQREKTCLVSLDVLSIETLSKEKDTLLLRLRLLEEERLRLMHKFVRDNNVKGDISLRKIYELSGDKDFQSLRLQLISLMQGITELNEFNKILIERSVSFIKNAANFLGVFSLKFSPENRGAVLSKEV